MKTKILYVIATKEYNNGFKFITEQGELTDNIEEAEQFENINNAVAEKMELDDPENFKIMELKVECFLSDLTRKENKR